ncbi:MAG: polyprenyl synthetase family protein [Pseudomonadota bacterium]
MNVEQAIDLVAEEMKAVETEMAKNLLSEITMIPTVSRYLIASGGKRFRPILLLLCAHLCGYHGPRAAPLASTIEYIHTATLLHDDVVDRAFVRRGMASANSVWGNGASVLVGDFLFTKSFSLIVQDGNLRILEVVSGATTRMAEGEVMQLVKMGDPAITEKEYYYVVTNKTAVLISAACQMGGILGTASSDKERALADFGLNLGIAFQLMDDTLDYISAKETLGKAIGQDFNEGKITLPLIQVLKVCSPAEKERLGQIIRDRDRREGDLEYVMKVVKDCGGIEYTMQAAENFIGKAKSSLLSFPPSREKEALQTLADYAIRRKW